MWTTEVLTRASQKMLTISYLGQTRGAISFYDEDELLEKFKKAVASMNEEEGK